MSRQEYFFLPLVEHGMSKTVVFPGSLGGIWIAVWVLGREDYFKGGGRGVNWGGIV